RPGPRPDRRGPLPDGHAADPAVDLRAAVAVAAVPAATVRPDLPAARLADVGGGSRSRPRRVAGGRDGADRRRDELDAPRDARRLLRRPPDRLLARPAVRRPAQPVRLLAA